MNPEPYGITDAPISSIARTNLMHVARTIQALAVSKHEGRAKDPKVAELLTHFPEVKQLILINLGIDLSRIHPLFLR